MDEDHEFKHVCKYCKKRFPCGRSLGGHMRSHMNTSTEIEEVNNTFMVGYDQNGTAHTGYGLRENPKKTWRSVSDSTKRGNFIGDNTCKECGKGFQSWKAYTSHLKSFHSQMYDEKSLSIVVYGGGGEEVEQVEDEEEEDYWSDRELEENQNLVMDSQSDNEATAPKRRRSKRTRYKNTNTIITPSTNNNHNNTTSCLSVENSSVSEISNEQEEVAMSLMMLSRDSSGYSRSELNCLVESSDNNSLFLEAKSSSLTKRASENELNNVNLNEKKKLKGKKKLGVTRFDGKRSELGGCYGSGFSRNGELEVSASFGEEGEFKRPKFDDELENSSYTRNRVNSKSARAELGKNLIREGENQSSFKYGKFNSSKRAKSDLYEDEFDRVSRKKAKYDGSDSEFCKSSSKKSKYKCTTCNKYFPSYQALGGHRASHKKIKGCSASKVDFSETSFETDLSPDPTADIKSCNNDNVSVFEVTASAETSPALKKNKHECPICFKVFSSGQALGGHKRSHLVGGSDTRSTPTIVLPQKLPVMRDLLDLNLPAPNDEETNTGDMGYEPWWVGNSHKHDQLVGLISN